MALTREFRETGMAAAQEDPTYRRSLLTHARELSPRPVAASWGGQEPGR
jgi:hypothetical protein